MLLRKLEKDHNFSVVDKIIELYNEIDTLSKPVVKKAIENVAAGKRPTEGMDINEVTMLNDSEKNRWTILSKLLSYCYPKLKALELASADHDKITFNINVPRENVEVSKAD